MKTLSLTAAAVIGVVFAGCASQPPTELMTARTAYQQAIQAPGANRAPTEIVEARRSLDRAEAAFAENGDELETRDLAYVAQRQALIARSKASTALAAENQQVALAELDRLKLQQQMAEREQLGSEKVKLTQEQLESERRARVAADARRREALKKIKGLTTKEDPRGLMVTLGGGVLFETGRSELLPSARKQLDDVVAALEIVSTLKEDRGRGITVIGHTDSVGDDEKNQTLSLRRAETVRNYIIASGISRDRVQAEGGGETNPVADNKTAQGRAKNRRVDIILTEPTSTKEKSQPGSGK